jgi:xanthine dehydrogenase molybdenum-binding subunit
MVAEVLGVSFDKVRITYADTESTPFEIGSHASRTCYASGTAVVAAANKVKEKALSFAAKILDSSKEELDIEENFIYSTLNSEIKIGLSDIALKAHEQGQQFIGVGSIIPQNAPPYLAQFAEVEVDLETGKVKVIKLVGANDVGKAINPLIVEGQLEGGLAMGIGYALLEEMKYDSKGRQLNTSYEKYMLPTSMDIPELQTIIVEANDPTGPFGAKGVGETGLVATAAAIANAVYDAIGIRFFELPLTEERVYKAIKKLI